MYTYHCFIIAYLCLFLTYAAAAATSSLSQTFRRGPFIVGLGQVSDCVYFIEMFVPETIRDILLNYKIIISLEDDATLEFDIQDESDDDEDISNYLMITNNKTMLERYFKNSHQYEKRFSMSNWSDGPVTVKGSSKKIEPASHHVIDSFGSGSTATGHNTGRPKNLGWVHRKECTGPSASYKSSDWSFAIDAFTDCQTINKGCSYSYPMKKKCGRKVCTYYR